MGGGIVRIAHRLRLGIMSFTTSITVAGTLDGLRLARQRLVLLSAG